MGITRAASVKPSNNAAAETLKTNKLGSVIKWTALSIVGVVQIFPLIWLINFSLVSNNEMFTSGLLVWPEQIRWDNYVTAFVDGHFLLYFRNSLIINVLSVLLVILFSIALSFACGRMRWKFSGLVFGIIMLGLMIPIHATLLPNFVIYDRLGITDTIFALLIPYVAFSLPQGLFLTSGFMQSIPHEIEEAAMIDGAGIYRILFQIITPMLKTSLVTVSIMTFLNNWNEFMMARTYLKSPTWKTLPFSVLEFTGMYASNYSVQFAVMALTALPVVIIYVILNKQITRGVAMGAVKG